MIKDVKFIAGKLQVTTDVETKEYDIVNYLRAADIPAGLTYAQVASISALANLVVILIRTLIDREILNESFLEDDDIDLDHLIAAIEAMGGSYHDPGLEAADE